MRFQILVLHLLCVVNAIFADTGTYADSYNLTVKALLDAGDANTCAAAMANSYCGSNATSFYETFNYTDTDGLYGDAGTVWRVMITSGAPDHSAESTLLIPPPTGYFNPNVRCETWQYAIVPWTPEYDGYSGNWSDSDYFPFYSMGAFGYATSGGVFFDTRSDSDGSTAWANEIDTLDVCMGHSNTGPQYHYHGVPYCMPSDTWQADNSSACQFLGYMMDGYPIYGRCEDTSGTELQSCWVANDDSADNLANYTYGATASGDICYLDQANGYTFTADLTSDGYAGYAYVTTAQFSGVPIGLMGSVFGTICAFTP